MSRAPHVGVIAALALLACRPSVERPLETDESEAEQHKSPSAETSLSRQLVVPELPEPPPLPQLDPPADLATADTRTIELSESPFELGMADDGAAWMLTDQGRVVSRLGAQGFVKVVELEGWARNVKPVPGTPKIELQGSGGGRTQSETLTIAPDGGIESAFHPFGNYEAPEGIEHSADVGGERWFVDERPGRLVRVGPNGSRVERPLDRHVRMIDRVIGLGEHVLVVASPERYLFTIDGQGRTRTLARVSRILTRPGTSGIDVLVDGTRIVWAERRGELDLLRMVHVHGGEVVTVLEVPIEAKLRLGSVHRGRAVVLVRSELRVLSLPEVRADPERWSADPRPRRLDELPVSEAALASIVSWGVRSVAELQNRHEGDLRGALLAMAPGLRTEVEYGLSVFRSHGDEAEPLPGMRLEPAYLEPIAALGLSPALTRALEDADLVSIGLVAAMAGTSRFTSPRVASDGTRLPPIVPEQQAEWIVVALRERGLRPAATLASLMEAPDDN